MTFSDTKYAKSFSHPEKAKIIRFIELMYGKESILHKITNLEDRQAEALKRSALSEAPSSDEFKKLWFDYLSFFEHNNRYTWLIIREELLYNSLNKLRGTFEDSKEEIAVKDSLDKLCERLIDGIEKGYRDVYGEMADYAEGKIKAKVAKSVEERLKEQNVEVD